MMGFHLRQSGKSLCWKILSIQTLLSKYIELDLNHIDRLKEVLFSQEQLYLVFEYLEYDLKKYMKKLGTALPA